MNSNKGALVVGLVVVVGAVVYGINASRDTDSMMKKDSVMESQDMMEKKDESMMDDGAMKEDEMIKDDSMMEGEAMMKYGRYEMYSADKLAYANDGSVVLFFNATWCPTCRAADTSFKASASTIPADLAILSVDYDTSTELKKKYGVTMQHTFVQVDASGNLIAKWTGSGSVADVVARIK